MAWSTNACCCCSRSSSAAASRRCLEAYDSTSSCLTTDDSTTAWSTSTTRSDIPPDTCAGQRQTSQVLFLSSGARENVVPGGVFVVFGAGLEAAVEDADPSV